MRSLALTLTIALAACTRSPMDIGELGGHPLEIRRDPAFQWFRSSSGVREPGTAVIRDVEGWQAAWETITANHSPRPALPAVDFAREMVVLVALGMRSSGGYSAEIRRVLRTGDGISVDYVARSPGSDCFVTGAITHPIDVVIVPRVDGTAVFAKHEQVTNC